MYYLLKIGIQNKKKSYIKYGYTINLKKYIQKIFSVSINYFKLIKKYLQIEEKVEFKKWL